MSNATETMLTVVVFTKLASQLTTDKLADLAIIPLIFIVQTLVSFLCSFIVSKVFGFSKRPRNFVIAMGVSQIPLSSLGQGMLKPPIGLWQLQFSSYISCTLPFTNNQRITLGQDSRRQRWRSWSSRNSISSHFPATWSIGQMELGV